MVRVFQSLMYLRFVKNKKLIWREVLLGSKEKSKFPYSGFGSIGDVNERSDKKVRPKMERVEDSLIVESPIFRLEVGRFYFFEKRHSWVLEELKFTRLSSPH